MMSGDCDCTERLNLVSKRTCGHLVSRACDSSSNCCICQKRFSSRRLSPKAILQLTGLVSSHGEVHSLRDTLGNNSESGDMSRERTPRKRKAKRHEDFEYGTPTPTRRNDIKKVNDELERINDYNFAFSTQDAFPSSQTTPSTSQNSAQNSPVTFLDELATENARLNSNSRPRTRNKSALSTPDPKPRTTRSSSAKKATKSLNHQKVKSVEIIDDSSEEDAVTANEKSVQDENANIKISNKRSRDAIDDSSPTPQKSGSSRKLNFGESRNGEDVTITNENGLESSVEARPPVKKKRIQLITASKEKPTPNKNKRSIEPEETVAESIDPPDETSCNASKSTVSPTPANSSSAETSHQNKTREIPPPMVLEANKPGTSSKDVEAPFVNSSLLPFAMIDRPKKSFRFSDQNLSSFLGLSSPAEKSNRNSFVPFCNFQKRVKRRSTNAGVQFIYSGICHRCETKYSEEVNQTNLTNVQSKPTTREVGLQTHIETPLTRCSHKGTITDPTSTSDKSVTAESEVSVKFTSTDFRPNCNQACSPIKVLLSPQRTRSSPGRNEPPTSENSGGDITIAEGFFEESLNAPESQESYPENVEVTDPVTVSTELDVNLPEGMPSFLISQQSQQTNGDARVEETPDTMLPNQRSSTETPENANRTFDDSLFLSQDPVSSAKENTSRTETSVPPSRKPEDSQSDFATPLPLDEIVQQESADRTEPSDANSIVSEEIASVTRSKSRKSPIKKAMTNGFHKPNNDSTQAESPAKPKKIKTSTNQLFFGEGNPPSTPAASGSTSPPTRIQTPYSRTKGSNELTQETQNGHSQTSTIRVATSGLATGDGKLVKRICGKLLTCAEFSPKVTETTTHLIVKSELNRTCQRTAKYIHAVSMGIWVLSFDWIKACMKAKNKAPEAPYEVHGDNHTGVCYGPKKSREAHLINEKLFAGYYFLFPRELSDLPSEMIRTWLDNTGGVLVTRACDFSQVEGKKLVIVEEHTDADRALCKRMRVRLVARDWFLECLTRYQILPFRAHMLFNPDVTLMTSP